MSLIGRLNQQSGGKNITSSQKDRILQHNMKIIHIDLTKIERSPVQHRRSFDKKARESLARSIEKHGLRTPVLVKTKADGTYRLIAGERRLQAHEDLGKTQILAAVLDDVVNEKDEVTISLIENFQRSNPNAYEEAIGGTLLLSAELQKPREDIAAHLNQLYNARETEEAQLQIAQIEGLFDGVGLPSFVTFVTTRLPTLTYPVEVQQLLNDNLLPFTHCQLLARIKDDTLRQKAIQHALQHPGITVSDLKKFIQKLILPTTSKQKTVGTLIQDNYKKTWKKMAPEDRVVLESLIGKIEDMLAKYQ
ncbi:ParB/RepB/Spo0J family partition protein [Deinococcus roseus]|uniref:Chromosome partitioning protein ParB n=1 Tax=Deinococcus roseus TaxID=392414 RepID=A0ABQ2DIL6_9DEIO|nr:ParB/RepB/Spo0J family partition protein [Deinococcus roseus]GGJ58968.1 chromosome partitioning protein ParB [Deinococcus roseus]